MCQSIFFNKVAGFRPPTLSKHTHTHTHTHTKSGTGGFSCELCEISKNTFFTEHLWTTASVQSMFGKLYFCETEIDFI